MASSQLEDIVEILDINILQRLIDNSIKEQKWIRAGLLMINGKPDSKIQYERYVNLICDGIREIEVSVALLTQVEESHFVSRLMIRQIELLTEKGENTSALGLINKMSDSGDYEDEIYSELQHLKEMIFVVADVNPTRIGVILPLSHRRFGPL